MATSYLTKLIAVVSTPVIIILVPILGLIFFLPVFIFRSLIILLRWIFFPNTGKILSPLSAFFAADRMYSEYPLSTNLITIVLEGNIPYQKLRESLVENVLKKRDLVSKKLVYPELQQKVVPWAGFHFWETDSSFHVDNHLRLALFPGYEGRPITKGVYVPFLKSLLREPFNKSQSPWEIIAIHNYKDEWDESVEARTLLIYRIHHALSGGYSSMNLLLDHGGLKADRSTAKFPYIPLGKKVLWNLLYLVRGPYEIVTNLLDAIDRNDWKLEAGKLIQEKSAAVSSQIPVQFIKDIKNAHNTSFSAVISAAIAGGIRDYMISKKIKTPKSIHVMTPWPVRDIPAKLGNFLTGVILEYPIGDPDPISRLHKIHNNFITMKYSTVATTNYYMLKLMGRLPYWLLRPAHANLMSTTIMSNVAGPNHLQICLGHPIKDMAFVANFMCANVALGFTVLSYNGHLKVVCGADRAIMPHDSDAEELMDKILLQLKTLNETPPNASHSNSV